MINFHDRNDFHYTRVDVKTSYWDVFCSLLSRWLHFLFPCLLQSFSLPLQMCWEEIKLISMSVRESLHGQLLLYRGLWLHLRDISYLHVHSAKKWTVLLLFHLSWRWIAGCTICTVDLCMFVGPRVWPGFYCFTQSHLQPGSSTMSCSYNP